MKKNSLESEINKLESKRKDLRNKFPCISDFLHLEGTLVEYTERLSRIRREDDIDNARDLIFGLFLFGMYNKSHSFENEISKIKQEKGNNYISYKYIIDGAKNRLNDGICMKVKFYCDSKKFGKNQPVSSIDSVDISLSKEGRVIAKIKRDFIKIRSKINS